MPCYHPLHAKYTLRSDGKKKITFSPLLSQAFEVGKEVYEKVFSNSDSLQLPCGRCKGCRLDRSRQWATRMMHEASMFSDNCFITLTYNDENLPVNGSLNKKHFQDFMKRLRFEYKGFDPVTFDGDIIYPIRFFHCGEYGDNFDRPHYHACLFNFDFPDKEIFKIVDGERLYTSQVLDGLWKKGFCTVGSLTFESAAYVARYCMKKITGKEAEEHYRKFDPLTGETHVVEPEYATMSRRPGIGHTWYEKFSSDLYPKDFVTSRGIPTKIPRYYDEKYRKENPEAFEVIKEKRRLRNDLSSDNNKSDRLRVKERVNDERIKLLKRTLD